MVSPMKVRWRDHCAREILNSWEVPEAVLQAGRRTNSRTVPANISRKRNFFFIGIALEMAC